MILKIVVIHSGIDYEALLLTSLLIGLKKKYMSSQILWVGNPSYFCLIKYNKRVKRCFNLDKCYDLSSLTSFYGSDVCLNISLNKQACKFASACGAKIIYGFDKNGPVDRNAEFVSKVLSGKVKTNKTVLDLYYSLAEMHWKGEGYGLSYYPKLKQTKKCGTYLHTDFRTDNEDEDCEEIELPRQFLDRFDVLNQYATIITDDLFVLHAGLALKKKVHCCRKLSYQLNF